ncbi:MAG TPA: beta/gamma crystallin-related protein [Casimicrobiaceae bacterium]|nr:beta/gamma crystallin-related protein [Casimicrobiaceae bacterium]
MRDRNRWKLKLIVAGALAAIATGSLAGQLTLYPRPGFQGQGLTTSDAMTDLGRSSFAVAGSSAVVSDGAWEVCTEAYFRGRCAQLVPGNYSNLGDSLGGMIVSVRQVAYEPAPARVVVYPDQRPPVTAVPAPVVINPGAAPVVINSAPAAAVVVAPDSRSAAAVVVAPDSRPIVVSPDAIPTPAGPRIVLYQNTPRGMRAVELTSNVDDLDTRNFSDSAYAAFVGSGTWRLCDHERGRGHCAEFAPGRYESLGAMEGHVRSAYLIATTPETVANVPNFPPGRAVLYEFPNYAGRSATIEYGRAPDLDWARFKQPAESLRVDSGTWLVCSEIGYQGECRVLGPGSYPHLTDLVNTGVYSARQIWRPAYGYIGNGRYATR